MCILIGCQEIQMLDAASPLLDVLVLMDTGSHDILLPEWGEWGSEGK